MEQNSKTKLNQKILTSLKSDKESENLSGLTSLRESGKAEYMPFLIGIYRESKHESVKKEAFSILCELKQQDIVPYLIDAIVGKENKKIQKKLIEVCWQNGLKYTQYLPLFVDLVIEEDDLTSFEALTVIENLEYLPDDDLVKKEVDKIEKILPKAGENKAYFLNVILKFLSQ